MPYYTAVINIRVLTSGISFGSFCILDPSHFHHTRFQVRIGAMAPPKADNPMSLLVAKIEEGNRETHRLMHDLHTSMTAIDRKVVQLAVG